MTLTCLFCTSPLRGKKKYCNNQCQQDFQRQERITKWLETGEVPTKWDITHPSHYVRQYIIQDQLHLCAICDGPDNWMGKELGFILDHVDGDAKNNRRDNLRLICPNCDSQLETSKGRNKGKGTREPRANRYH